MSTHSLIASRFLGDHLILRPGYLEGLRVPRQVYLQLRDAATRSVTTPRWLTTAARDAWDIDLAGRTVADAVLVREETRFEFGRASYELNLGCNYACEHCYLGLKTFAGLTWPDRQQLLYVLRDAGVLWLQLTGGEPLIDKLYAEVHALAYELGMMIAISTNGSRLANPKILDLLTTMRPYRIVVSVYGATTEAYEALTKRRGSFGQFNRGLAAAYEADLPLKLNLVATTHNAHEVDAMRAMAETRGLEYTLYTNMSPTIYGGPESLPSQAGDLLSKRRPFTGCNAGHTFFHVDPHGMASICKVGRDPSIPLMTEGVEGLARLGNIADRLLLRQGGCSGCQLSGTCGTCMPLATLYRKANAPLATYCQHATREEVTTCHQ